MTHAATTTQGWSLDLSSERYHCYDEGQSLCGRYRDPLGDRSGHPHDHPENCRVCRDLLEDLEAAGKAVRP